MSSPKSVMIGGPGRGSHNEANQTLFVDGERQELIVSWPTDVRKAAVVAFEAGAPGPAAPCCGSRCGVDDADTRAWNLLHVDEGGS